MVQTDTYRLEWEEHQRVVADAAALLPTVAALADRLCEALGRGGKLLVFGNGGSAADAQHFAGELLGRFRSARRPLSAMALTTDPSVVTCIANDFSYEDVFGRQVEALTAPGDVVIGITTSGGSENVVRGLRAARERGALAVAWTGADAGRAGEAAEMVLAVPSATTARIQEVHTLAMHAICVAVDEWAAGAGGAA
jgi:D-sedoheptulose 7-phosphate isomerase